MNKSLTEKWKDGELISGHYYVRSGWSKYIEVRYLGGCFFEGNIEIIEPVPSYEELREKEVIYNTTSRCNETLLWENESLKNKVGKLKEQLNEANRIIKKYAKGKFKCEVIYPDGSKPSVKLSKKFWKRG